jgi:hypothetical protein
MKQILLIIIWMLVLAGVASAQKTCQRVTATSQNCIATVSWTASVADAAHDAPANYVIRRGDGGGAMAQIGTVVATTTSFQNTFTDAGNVAHCWDVIATKSAQSSPPSTQVCWTTPAIAGQAPNAPVGVSIAAINSSVLRITWDDVDDETGYQIWGREAKGPKTAATKLATLAPDVTTWDWAARKRYTSYCVGIVATGNPDSPASQTACSTTSK